MRYCLLIIFIFLGVLTHAQVIVIDSTKAPKAINKIVLKDSNDVHSPRKAAIMSAVIP